MNDFIDSFTCDIEGGESFFAKVETSGERIDVFAAKICNQTRSFVQKLIEQQAVLVNGKTTKANYKLKFNDEVIITIKEPTTTELVPENIPLNIVYEDSDILVINKPKGMVVHPAVGNETGTLVNAIMFHAKDLSGIGGEIRPGIVHRIDKMTSGLIVVAKNDYSHRHLAHQIKEHSAKRVYVALVHGNIKEDAGIVNAPIARHIHDRKKMSVNNGGREAITHWRVAERFGDYTLLVLRLETGRTHQIRVHMSYIKHPVVGDDVYGGGKNKFGLDGQALHAARLKLVHPKTGQKMLFAAELPNYFIQALKRLTNIDGYNQTQDELHKNLELFSDA